MTAPDMLATHLSPNCFDPDAYYSVDIREGVMRNRFGTKCCTFSAHALRGVVLALKDEVGPAWRMVLRGCGAAWGKRFAARFVEEISEFYGQSLDVMSIGRFNALIEECFAVSGWGRLRLDYSRSAEGIVCVEVQNEILGDLFATSDERTGVLLEGVLLSFFSHVTGQDLDCYETDSIGRGALVSLYVIGARPRLKPVPAWLDQGANHEQILERLRTS